MAVYQVVPSTGTGDEIKPDSKYYLRIKEGMSVRASETGTIFRSTEILDFADSTDREISVYNSNEGAAYSISYKKICKGNICRTEKNNI